MTDRKPPEVSFDDWIERQIRSAEERGVFDNLPGAGKPLPGAGRRPGTASDWVADLVKREKVDTSVLLPPSLALPKELEDLPERLSRERSEATVRKIVQDLNERIRQAHRLPQAGPPLRAMPVDVEETVRAWRENRSK
ncbi:DUF1992 domain-containing protein [Amycolatopsis nigrescens]|uniref:DnaJ family domain-containing protein n=1 Tax=Amycolatopsis nigrescens TaxID=381445 RepID=UPI000379ADC4|nr:DUF1992 domain-containing protein [Amycolatopsis nigrescens]